MAECSPPNANEELTAWSAWCSPGFAPQLHPGRCHDR